VRVLSKPVGVQSKFSPPPEVCLAAGSSVNDGRELSLCATSDWRALAAATAAAAVTGSGAADVRLC
jgi:hypothetical protein